MHTCTLTHILSHPRSLSIPKLERKVPKCRHPFCTDLQEENKEQQQIVFLCGRKNEGKVTIIEYNSSKLTAETLYFSSET